MISLLDAVFFRSHFLLAAVSCSLTNYSEVKISTLKRLRGKIMYLAHCSYKKQNTKCV